MGTEKGSNMNMTVFYYPTYSKTQIGKRGIGNNTENLENNTEKVELNTERNFLIFYGNLLRKKIF